MHRAPVFCLLSLLALSACAEQTALTSDEIVTAEAAEPGARRNLVLTLADVHWGEAATFTVNGANPGEEVVFTWSPSGQGVGPCPAQLGGLCLDLAPPVRIADRANADANGAAQITFPLPATGPAGSQLSAQAVVERGVGGVDSVKSNPTTQDITTLVDDSFAFERGMVDVLFVVDDSCSMTDEQQDLINAFPFMIDFFDDSGLDWRVGVVSTDMDNAARSGKLVQDGAYRWIDDTTPNADGVFANMAGLGASGSGIERGLEAMATALGPLAATFNAGYRRSDAQLAVLVLSDEDDSSSDTPTAYADFLAAQTYLPGDARLHSLVDTGVCGQFQAGTRYLEVTQLTDGAEWPICQLPYTSLFADVGDSLASSQPMFLSDVPLGDIDVVATEPFGVPFLVDPADWEFFAADNAVRIMPSYRPPVGTSFSVQYESL